MRDTSSHRSLRPGARRAADGGISILVLAWLGCIAAMAACGPAESTSSAQDGLARFDSLLADLSGPQTADLSRSQRWRLLASVGTGLPPTSYRLEDLPEPGSRAVGLQQAYCLQCHGPASPRMHTAEEWPVLVRRMLARGAALHDRLGGPRTEGLVDEMLMAGLRTAVLPSPEDADSLIAYFRRNALPAATPGEIPDSPEARFYVAQCSVCHETPSPAAHGPEGAEALVGRMSALRGMLGMKGLTEAEKSRIVAFLLQMSQ